MPMWYTHTMKPVYKISIIIMVILLGVGLWAGLLQPVEVVTEINPRTYAVYVKHYGSPKTAPTSLVEVQRYLKEKGVQGQGVFVAYQQDPTITPDPLMVTWVGVVVSDPVEIQAPYELFVFEPRENIKAHFKGHPILASLKTRSRLEQARLRLSSPVGLPWIEISKPYKYGQYIVDVWIGRE